MKTEKKQIDLRYPIGRFTKPISFTVSDIEKWISIISDFPAKLKSETIHLNDEQLDIPYRDDGWTIRQVVHHCADSHMNSLCRFKLALTEKLPTIKPYFEDRWAELADSKTMPIKPAITMLEGLHLRWVFLMNTFNEQEFERKFYHPENGKEIVLKEIIALYAWHCSHHLAHITNLKKRMGWR